MTNPVGLGQASTGGATAPMSRPPHWLGPSACGQGDLLAVRGQVLELVDDARHVIGDGNAAAAVSVGQQLVTANPEHAGPFAGPDGLSGDA